MCFVSLTTSRIFIYIAGLKQFDYYVHWSYHFRVSLAWGSFSFLNLQFIIFTKVEKSAAIISLNTFFYQHPLSSYVYIRLLNVVTLLTDTLPILFSPFSLFHPG